MKAKCNQQFIEKKPRQYTYRNIKTNTDIPYYIESRKSLLCGEEKLQFIKKFTHIAMLNKQKMTRHVLECMGYKLRVECHCYVERGKNYFLH